MARTKQTSRKSTSSEPIVTEEEKKMIDGLTKRETELRCRLRAANCVEDFLSEKQIHVLKEVLEAVLSVERPLNTSTIRLSLEQVVETRREIRQEIRERHERQVRSEEIIEASERYEREAAAQRSRSRSPVRSREPVRARSPLSFVPRV